MKIKLCKKCGKEKEVNCYRLKKDKSGKYYYYSYCKECETNYHKQHYGKHINNSIGIARDNPRLYRIYHNMMQRCYNYKNQRYKNYGGRGIIICKDWLGFKGFENFYNWAINNGYNSTLTLDRIDVNGNYEPSNCRWATQKEQANNRTNNLYIKHKNKMKTLSQWSKELNMSSYKLKKMINKNNEF